MLSVIGRVLVITIATKYGLVCVYKRKGNGHLGHRERERERERATIMNFYVKESIKETVPVPLKQTES